MNNEYSKSCPECKEQYEAKRLNQVYCSQKCKTRYNNRKVRMEAYHKNKVIESTNDILWRNREILRKLGPQQYPISKLSDLGFDKNFITRFSKIEVNGKKKNCNHIYDHYFYFIDSNLVKIDTE